MHWLKCILFFALFSCSIFGSYSQQIALLKYNGGGDWYANPTALPNLVEFCNQNIGTTISSNIPEVEPGKVDIFQYPMLHMTGHGNVVFNPEEIENLRTYLLSGGFLHIDDNYGMRPYLEKELEKLFPDKEWLELPASHPIFSAHYVFDQGLPKIHEHDNLPPQAFAFFEDGRMLLLFTFETDLGDGWESPEVHNDPPEVRQKALQMGANIIKYVFEN